MNQFFTIMANSWHLESRSCSKFDYFLTTPMRTDSLTFHFQLKWKWWQASVCLVEHQERHTSDNWDLQTELTCIGWILQETADFIQTLSPSVARPNCGSSIAPLFAVCRSIIVRFSDFGNINYWCIYFGNICAFSLTRLVLHIDACMEIYQCKLFLLAQKLNKRSNVKMQ